MFSNERSRNELRRANSRRTWDSCERCKYIYTYRTRNNKMGINEVILVNWTLFGDNISTASVTGAFAVVVASVLTVALVLRRWQRSILLCASRKQAANFTWRPSTNWRRISSVHPRDSSTGGNQRCAAATHHAQRRMCSVVGGFIYQTGVDVRMIYLQTVIGRENAKMVRSYYR